MSSATRQPRFQRPVWLDNSEEAPLDAPSASATRRVEVAVIGGGYTGLSTALHLAARGIEVALLEADCVGSGASGVNGGQVIPGLKRDPEDLERRFPDTGREITGLFGSAAELVFSLIDQYGIRCAPLRNGWIQAAHAASALPPIQSRARQWQDRGADVTMLSAGEIAGMTGAKPYAGGLLDRRAGTVQPLAYARGLARAARTQGAALFENSRVMSLLRRGMTWRLLGEGFEIAADHVVIATDAYSDNLLPTLARSILTVSSLQIATEPLSSDQIDVLPTGACMSETRKVAIYLRRDPHGRLLIGGRGPIGNGASTALFVGLQSRLNEIFPQAQKSKIAYQWQGRVGLTMDELPHLHEPQPGVHVGLGYNGRGVGAATTMGKIIADRITNGPLADVLPVTKLSVVPWRVFRQPLLTAAVSYYRLRDRLGFGN